jgi:hypothetical protein
MLRKQKTNKKDQKGDIRNWDILLFLTGGVVAGSLARCRAPPEPLLVEFVTTSSIGATVARRCFICGVGPQQAGLFERVPIQNQIGGHPRMSDSSESERWTWDSAKHPHVLDVLSPSGLTGEWYDKLENWYDKLEEAATDDFVTGKVLCVVAGIAIAKAVVMAEFHGHERRAEAVQLLDLADAWVDDPTNERFDQITEFLFDDDREFTDPNDPLNVTWCALRIATSCVGAGEAAWALSSVDDCAKSASLDAREIARVAVKTRSV